jgi:hypothetical protein
MPTVPLLLASVPAANNPLGYNANFFNAVLSTACQGLSGRLTWDSGGIITPAPGWSVTPGSLPTAPSDFCYEAVSITYDDIEVGGWAVSYANNFIDRKWLTAIPLFGRIGNVAYDITFPDADTAQISFTWYDRVKQYWDGAYFYEGLSKLECRVGGSGGTIYTITGSGAGSPTYSNVQDGSGNPHTYAYEFVNESGTITVPKNSAPVEVRLTNSYGEHLPWQPLHINPSASFSAAGDGQTFALDASGTFVYAGSITNYRYQYTDPSSGQLVTINTASPLYTLDLSALSDVLNTDTSLIINLLATSGYGCAGSASQTVTVEPAPNLGLLIDHAGHVLAAVKSGSGVQVYEFPSGSASRIARALVPNTKNPSLRLDKDGSIHLLSQDSDGVWRQRSSSDGGRSFT